MLNRRLGKRQSRQRAVIAAFALLAVLVGALLFLIEEFDTTLQAAVYDRAIALSPAHVRNQITIVAIDDRTIAAYNVYPLPRRAFADLLKALKPLDPSVVAFDVSFYEPSPVPADDAAFAAAIKDSGNVILAMQGNSATDIGEHRTRFAAVQLPIKELRDAAAGLGAVYINPDPDHIVRDSPLVIEAPDGTRYYGLPLAAAAKHLRTDVSRSRVDGDRLILPAALGDRVMPIDRAGGMSIYYAAPPATPTLRQATPCAIEGEFCVVSLRDVVAGTVPRNLITGRTVFVGAHSLSAVPDDYPVPHAAGLKMFGVEIWANTAQSIFTNRYPVLKQGFVPTLLQLLIVTLLGLVFVVRWHLRGFLAALGLLVVYVFGAYVLFGLQTNSVVGTGAVEVPSVGYVAPAAFWWVIALGYLLVEERSAVNRTQSTFGRFVTPSVARTIMQKEDAGELLLGGEERQVTVLFGDIRGFTTMSEGMNPSILLGHLNRYFEGMVEVVNRFSGTVNKYNGDNIMVIWNAPIEVPDHARKAVQCALEMQAWIQSERAKGGPDVSFGFGINSGSVVAGFLGAKGRMEYTVIGDTANVASRLTSADIARRDQVACSADTLAALGDDVSAIDLGAIAVKGRAEPVLCFQINRIGTTANPNPAPAPALPVTRAAVAGYH
ncbi:MAG TPA: adenylate/guanylate cyclase domain-containing protein [Candidatus Limnocylindrales bacterium]|nr:adenylate/guanylate cyclase domain-containing protein [Candidatus Limnocylindrales bacterium]